MALIQNKISTHDRKPFDSIPKRPYTFTKIHMIPIDHTYYKSCIAPLFQVPAPPMAKSQNA